MRKSTVTTHSDSDGKYEVEIFDTDNPKSVVVCAHGKGVRRWDGEHFYHNLAEHYRDRAFLLVDQTQPYKDGCAMTSFDIMIARVQQLVSKAKHDYPGVPIVVVGHSFGCAVSSRLDLTDVSKVVFVAPAAGDETAKLLDRYGDDIVNGKETKSSDGLTKFISKEFVDSVRGKVWEEEYQNLLARYKEVYCFESDAEEIVGDERLEHRKMPFAGYEIIEGALHNYSGDSLNKLCNHLDKLL